MPVRTTLQQHSTALVKGLVAQAEALDAPGSELTTKVFRELFVTKLLSRYVPEHLGIGTGVIVNQLGIESPPIDVVVYDKRLVPPFLRDDHVGVFPVESVVHVIAVKNRLGVADLRIAESAASRVKAVSSRGTSYDPSVRGVRPRFSVFALKPVGLAPVDLSSTGLQWWQEQLQHVWAVCCVGQFSVLRRREWKYRAGDTNYEETKRYLAVMMDHARTQAESSYRALWETHTDWIGAYTRENPQVTRLRAEKSAMALEAPGSHDPQSAAHFALAGNRTS